ncbi:hybrid sensor histidine kinase/response regulator [Streptomyces griseorubiginosus]|uniref:hybrid sensor histidine kinase/response regulator n=1 Tax=Streptomyces griseorubiginosus TaxID=67304 RepID=UPI00365F897A
MSSRPSRGAARLAAILDALPDALVLVNANGTVVNANTIALEAFEAPGTALVGRGLLDLLPEFDSRLIPGSMRRPDHMDPRGRTKPTRMVARRTDGTEFPVEVTSANLENGQQAYDGYGYSGDELLMLVVRDLTGTVDTEAELARSQRQTEMILRAAAEGVVGTDTDGRIVLVNPAAAQILGYRASDLGGRELHDLILHSRADGTPFSYEESPLADTLRSGRKHRVRGQVLWSKKGEKVPVDLTTAPVRDGDQLVGAVLTFTDRRPYDALADEKSAAERAHAEELERLEEEHASELTALRQKHITELEELQERHDEEIAAGEERYAALGEREKDRYEALAGRHDQLLTLLGRSLRGPLDELRRELSALAADDAGQLWPEANQVLHHLSAGYSRITHLIDNVLGYQRLDAGADAVVRTNVMLDAVVAAGVDGAVELIGPGRVQFAVHAPPIEAEVDAQRLATALAHLIADVAGVDATGNAPVSAGGYMDNTVVVAAALRGESVRIEVRGPYAGGDPVHEPIVRGIVRAHGGVLQTHEVPGMSGSAYVLEVPIGGGAGAVAVPGPAALEAAPVQAAPMEAGSLEAAPGTDPGENSPAEGGGRRRARRASTDSFLDGDVPADADESSAPTGRRRRRAAADQEQAALALPAQASGEDADGSSGGTGRRRGRPAEGADGTDAGDTDDAGVSEGAVVTAAEHAAGSAAVGSGLGGTVPPQGVPAPAGRRARRDGGEQHALPAALPAGGSAGPGQQPQGQLQIAGQPAPGDGTPQQDGRRRRALAAASERAAAQEAAPRSVFALPPADADRPAGADTDAGAAGPAAAQGQPLVPGQPAVPGQPLLPGQPVVPGQLPGQAQVLGQVPAQGMVPGQVQTPVQVPQVPAPVPDPSDGHGEDGRHDAVPHDQADDHTPPQPHPTTAPTGRRRRAVAQPPEPAGTPAQGMPAQGVPVQAAAPVQAVPGQATPGQAVPAGVPTTPAQQVPAAVPPVQYPGVPVQNATGQAGLVPQPVAAPASPVQAASPQAASPQAATPQAATPQAAPAQAAPAQPVLPQGVPGQPGLAQPGQPLPGQPLPAEAPRQQTPAQATPVAQPWLAAQDTSGAGIAVPPNQPTSQPAQTPAPGSATPPPGVALPADAAHAQAQQAQAQAQALQAQAQAQALQAQAQAQARAAQAQPLPAEAATAAAATPVDPNSTQGRAISVRTLGQGVPFTRQAAQVQQPGAATPPPHQSGGSGRRRKLGTRPDPAVATAPKQAARPHPTAEQTPASAPAAQAAQVAQAVQAPQPQPSLAGQSRLAHATEAAGRSYAIGAPDENAAEGPEPLDGPGGAVEIPDTPRPQPMDDELPPEPLDNPRRLLVWPAPDVTTQQALSDRGYRPVIVQSREEVDAQIAAFPAALFVDPLTGPITRTALQSLRQAAVASEVPIMVTAGLGQASREAAYGADPAVLLKALAPRDSEQHPPRVLLIEEHAEIALALTATLERRGMQVARAASDADAVTLAGQLRPNLVVMDLMQVHRRRAGIVDWLRANGQLNRTPLVVYTAAVDQADLPRLASGETVLFLAERSTSAEVQARIVDLLARIGTN